MNPQKPQRQLDRALLRRILGLFAPHRVQVIRTIFAVIIGVVLGIVPPFLVQHIVDDGLSKGNLNVIASYSGLTLIAVLAGAGMTLLYGYWSVIIGQEIMCELRQKLYVHLQGMSLRFFTSTRTGEIQTRMISDVGGIQNVVSNTLTDQLSNIGIVISALIAMFWLDWRLTLLSLAMVPVFMVVGKWVGEFARKVRTGVQEKTSDLNSMMQETLSVSGVLLTKTAGHVDVLASQFAQENKELARWQIKNSVVQYLFFGMIRMITQLAPTLVYWLAGYLMVTHGDSSITVGKLMAFTGLQVRLFFPMTGLLSAQVEIMSSFALFSRIFEYLDMPRDINDTQGARDLRPEDVRGEVSFENVWFAYESTEGEETQWTLSDVSFEAKPGQLVALVGHSGAGKTTMTYLIPRFYDPDKGQIKIDGAPLQDYTLQSLTRVIGAVTQETYLMHTTIKENMRVARPDATDAEIIDACKKAAIHDHIAGLADGYDTVVGERGYKLSGGEKQRLAIARTILKNPRILILDEATSALDTVSERIIQNSLNELMEGRTTFAIAHRLSTILAADLILVMRAGQIVERGTHSELLALEGEYAKLYNEQFKSEQLLPN